MLTVPGAAFCSADSMLSVSRALDERKESSTLVVLTSALQLALVVLVWLLVLIPAALAALTILTVKTVRAALRRPAVSSPPVEENKP